MVGISGRRYAHTGESFGYARWRDAIRAGQTFVSTGPVINLTANVIGAELRLNAGDAIVLEATVDAPPKLVPIEGLEIVVGPGGER